MKPVRDGEMVPEQQLYPHPTGELTARRKQLDPGAAAAFHAFSKSVFEEGALSGKVKQLIAVAVAHVTQCPYCIRGHTTAAVRTGSTAEEIMEAIWVAAEMRAGGTYAHSLLALDQIAREEAGKSANEKTSAMTGTGAPATIERCRP